MLKLREWWLNFTENIGGAELREKAFWESIVEDEYTGMFDAEAYDLFAVSMEFRFTALPSSVSIDYRKDILRDIVNAYWSIVVKPVLEWIGVHANSLDEIMLVYLTDQPELIYLELLNTTKRD